MYKPSSSGKIDRLLAGAAKEIDDKRPNYRSRSVEKTVPSLPVTASLDQAFSELARQLEEAKTRRSFFGNDQYVPSRDDVDTQAAKRFPKQALDSVAHHRVADLGANGHAQPNLTSAGLFRDDHKICCMVLFTRAREINKLRSFS